MKIRRGVRLVSRSQWPAVRSKWTVFARSNPTQVMDICVRLFCVRVLCVGSGLATGWSPVQGVLPTLYYYYYYYGSTALCWALAAYFSFLILHTVGRTPSTGDQPVARPLSIHRTTHNTDIHASGGIQTHDPSVRAGKDSSCLRPGGHCDRPRLRID
jgi:hypothetical protein